MNETPVTLQQRVQAALQEVARVRSGDWQGDGPFEEYGATVLDRFEALALAATGESLGEGRLIHPGDVVAGNRVFGQIQVRANPDEMPESGTEVSFAEDRWLVTQTGVHYPGGRSTFIAVLLP